jgi:hypothetical protein
VRERYWWEDENTPLPPPRFVGLDLGQARDFSGLAVLERTESPPPTLSSAGVQQYLPRPGIRHYAVRHLRRWPVGTRYPTVVDEVAREVNRPELLEAPVAVDQTGVGRPVVDMLRLAGLAGRLWPVTITAGHSRAASADGITVPKRELISGLQVLLQSRRLQVAKALPESRVLLEELSRFQTKITPAGSEVFGAWRSGSHDDLVVAVALAAWLGENEPVPYDGPLVYWPEVPFGR